MRVLLLGESWTIHSIHQKGFDTFTTTEFEEGGHEFVSVLRSAGHQVTRIPAHLIHRDLPSDSAGLHAVADVVVVSDVGANSFLLAPETLNDSVAAPDRTATLRDFVATGGGLLMVGGYMTFSGIDAKARWGRSGLAAALPVEVLDRDDRIELPAGARPIVGADHEVVRGLSSDWPVILGMNEVIARQDANVLVTCEGHPLVVLGRYGAGRSAAFTSDLAPHWAPPEFLAWDGYGPLFNNLVRWLQPLEEDRA